MQWNPDFRIVREQENTTKDDLKNAIDQLYELPRNPISDTTQFIVQSTTIDSQKITDPRFKRDFETEMMTIDKFSALSNIDLTDQMLTRLIRKDMQFAKKFGMTDRYRRMALEIIAIYNESRGRGGFFQEAMITQKQELTQKYKEEQEQKKRSWFSRKKDEQNEQYQQVQQQ